MAENPVEISFELWKLILYCLLFTVCIASCALCVSFYSSDSNSDLCVCDDAVH
jgi:hypothetical protein